MNFRKFVAPGSLRAVHYVFAAGLGVRLLALAQLTGSAAFQPTGGDTLFYHQWAERILHGQLTDRLAFYGLPLYAYWLAALYKLFGTTPFVPLLLQAIADAATAALIYKIAATVFADRADQTRRASVVGILAAGGWLLFVPAAAYSAVLMPTALGVFVFWLVVWWTINSGVEATPRRCFLAGLLIGIAAMGVANATMALPLVLIAVLRRRALSGQRRLAAITAVFLGFAIGTSGCWLHNRFVARDPVFLSAHTGVNFWIGNNPNASGYPHFPGLRAGQAEMLSDSIAISEAAAGRPLKRSEVSAFWTAKARGYIAGQPLHWLRTLARKLANFWNAFEYDDIAAIDQLRRERVILPGLHFGIVAAFALPGLLFAWRAAPVSRWVALAVGLQLLAIMAVFVTERYRLAAVPGLLLFASFGLTRFYNAVARANWRGATAYIAVLSITSAFVSVPRTAAALWALSAYNAGRQALDAGDLKVAEQHLERSRAYVPNNAETNFALGNLRFAQGDRAAAEQLYRQTLLLDRRHKGALSNLGVLALDNNALDAAEMYFRQALVYDSGNAKAHFLLAKTLLGRGAREEALAETNRAIALNPAQPEFRALRDQINGPGK